MSDPDHAADDVRFVCGTPSLEESGAFWKRSEEDPFITSDEFYAAYGIFQERLVELGVTGWSRRDADFDFRGEDLAGDGTQYLELANPEALTTELLNSLQSWLREPQFERFRMIVATYISAGGVLVIYPHTVRFGSWFGPTLETALEKVRRIMRRGTRGNTRDLLVDWPQFVRRAGDRVLDLRWYYEWKREDWFEQHGPPNWLPCKGIWEGASDVYDALRDGVTAKRRRQWDKVLAALWWDGHSTCFDVTNEFDRDMLYLVMSPESVQQYAAMARELDVAKLEKPFGRRYKTREGWYFGRFDEFAEFVRSWFELLDKADQNGRGIVSLSS